MPPTDLLRRATKDPLDALERPSPIDAKGQPHGRYATWLRIVAVVVGALERALDEAHDATVAALWHDELRAWPRLAAALVGLDAIPAQATPAIEPMLALVDELRRWPREQPVRLLGALHASGAMLARTWPDLQLAAHAEPGAPGPSDPSAQALGTPPAWDSLPQRLAALEPSSAVLEHIIDGARRFLAGMGEIVQALTAGDHDPHAIVRALNPEAGSHPVTCDPRELMAAIDAGSKTWHQHPYYEARYGARGRRFTRSDSAWLVSLAELGEHARLRHLDWLARLLSARGMPSLLLETHMHNLHEALVAAVPERAARYTGLEAAGQRLRDRRMAAVPNFDALAATVPPHEQLGHLGPLLISAVADEQQGLQGAVSSVVTWLVHSQSRSTSWLAAVHHTLDLARRR